MFMNYLMISEIQGKLVGGRHGRPEIIHLSDWWEMFFHGKLLKRSKEGRLYQPALSIFETFV
jgi:hypothetical protein